MSPTRATCDLATCSLGSWGQILSILWNETRILTGSRLVLPLEHIRVHFYKLNINLLHLSALGDRRRALRQN